MFSFGKNHRKLLGKLSRDEFRAKSKKRFNFLHMIGGDRKKDLNAESFFNGEKLPKV